MNVLLDVNVVLDVLLRRAPWSADADAIWNAHHAGRINAKLSAAALSTIFYVVRRQAGWSMAHDAIDDCVSTLEVLSVDLPVVRMAQSLSGRDFEDNLQAACAIESQCSAIVTRDASGFPGLPIDVLSPADLLARIP